MKKVEELKEVSGGDYGDTGRETKSGSAYYHVGQAVCVFEDWVHSVSYEGQILDRKWDDENGNGNYHWWYKVAYWEPQDGTNRTLDAGKAKWKEASDIDVDETRKL